MYKIALIALLAIGTVHAETVRVYNDHATNWVGVACGPGYTKYAAFAAPKKEVSVNTVETDYMIVTLTPTMSVIAYNYLSTIYKTFVVYRSDGVLWSVGTTYKTSQSTALTQTLLLIVEFMGLGAVSFGAGYGFAALLRIFDEAGTLVK